ncbi:alpha/beta hydrolase [Pelagibacterium montanilacus]|uniref:alpha/beta hydrolase n=1 Tax=Pelagibacterium montanilacus TaxID=2185280 RepID=UPI0013DED30D|nr:alpha/beta hydrolase [Pelagibacterium montanilacus]
MFPRRYVNPAPFQTMVGPEFERVVLVTIDGESLKAYWKPPTGNAPVIIAFHGNGSLPEPMAARFGQAPWAEAGFGVLAFAYRGYPGSTGRPSETGLIEDGESALRFVRDRAPASPVVLHGYSLGSGVAVAISERHDSLGLVLEAPFSSLPDVVATTIPFLPGFLMHDTFVSQQRIARSRAAYIIVTHGDHDQVVPPSLGQRLFASAPHGQFLPVIGANHYSLLGKRDGDIVDILTNGYPADGNDDLFVIESSPSPVPAQPGA